MTRSTGLAMPKSYGRVAGEGDAGSPLVGDHVGDHVGAREFVVDGPSRDPGEGKGEQPERGLHHSGARTVDRDHALPHDQAAERATGGAPAGDVIGGGDALERGQARPLAYEAGEREAESDVDGGRPHTVLRGCRHAWRRFPAADVQEVE